MTGAEGPYVQLDGPLVWVPRTVPYLRARHVAATANQNGDRLVYRGKEDATLIGLARKCQCEEVCEASQDENGEPNGDEPCRVPAWKFELVEP